MEAQYTYGIVVAIAVLLVIILAIGWWQKWFLRRALDQEKFRQRWQELQQLCGEESTWSLAVINADKLVDEALKKRGFKGKSMGERLVSAQRNLKSNDDVWRAHKLRNKLVHEDLRKLRKTDVKDALMSFREALKDLGAL